MAVFGDTLRQARAYKGVTLKEAEQATRINRHHLAALEDENFGVLPPLIYQRGIVRNYATYLDLDPGKSLAMFEEARGGRASAELVAAVKPLDMPSHWAPNFAIIAFLVVMSAVVFAWTYSAFYAPEGSDPTAPPMPPTVTPVPQTLAGLPSPTPFATSPEVETRVESVATSTARVVRTTVQSPTQTPEPTATRTVRATATTAPTEATLEAEAEAETGDGQNAVPEPEPRAQEVDVEEAAPQAEEPPAPQGDLLGITISPAVDIYLTVVADGAPVYDGPVGAGQTVGPFYAVGFEVSTSDSANTQITNLNNGNTFNMGPGLPYFTLP